MVSLTYIHARPDTEDASGIFYVGKGTPRRAKFACIPRNPHYANVVRKHGTKNILIGTIECSSEEAALQLERGLIKFLKSMGVNLTNMTDGGEGWGSGEKHWTKLNPEKVKRGAEHKNFGKVRSEESNRKNSEWHKGRPAVNKGARGEQRWVTDGVTSKCVKRSDVEGYLTSGWRIGRIMLSNKSNLL